MITKSTSRKHPMRCFLLALLGALALALPARAQVYQNFFIDASVPSGQDAQTWWNAVCATSANQNFGGMDHMYAQRWTWFSVSCGEGENQSYLEFDLSGAHTNKILTNATLKLYYPTGNVFTNTTGNNDLYVERVTSSWSEATVTWNTAPGTTATNQASIPAGSSTTQNWSMDITGIARDWLCGGQPNYGVQVRLQNPTTYRRANFATGNHANSALHPELELEWAEVNISTGSSFPVCDGSIISLTANINGTAAPYLYTWYDPNGNVIGNTASINPAVIPGGGVYQVVVSLNGCTMNAQISVPTTTCCGTLSTPYTKFHNTFSGVSLRTSVLLEGDQLHMDNNGNIFMPGFYDAGPFSDAVITKIEPNGNNPWTTQVGDPGVAEASHATLPLANGDIVMAGQVYDPNTNTILLMAQLFDPNGALLWSRIITQSDHNIFGPHITQISSGDLIIAFQVNGSITSASADLGLVQMDIGGNILQYKELDHFRTPSSGVGDIIATSDGGFLIVGNAGPSNSSNDYIGGVAIKYDAGINFQWTTIIRTPTTSGIYDLSSGLPAETSISQLYGVIEDFNTGNFIAVGRTTDNVVSEGWLVTIDPTGLVIGVNMITQPNSDFVFRDVAQAANGELLVTGSRYDGNSNTHHILIYRFDNAMNLQNATEHNGLFVNGNFVTGIQIFEYPGNTDILVYGMDLTTSGIHEPFVLRTDQNGANGCELSASPTDRNKGYDEFNWTLIEYPINYNDIQTIQTQAQCQDYVENCTPSLLQFNPPKQGSGNQTNSHQNVALGVNGQPLTQPNTYPVPADEVLNLDLGTASATSLNITLTDMLGRTILNTELPALHQTAQLQTAAVPAGVYLLQISNANGIVFTQKVNIHH